MMQIGLLRCKLPQIIRPTGRCTPTTARAIINIGFSNNPFYSLNKSFIHSSSSETTLQPDSPDMEVVGGLLDDTDLEGTSALKLRAESLPSQIFRKGPDEHRTIPLIRGIVTNRFNLDLMVFGELPSKAITDQVIEFCRIVDSSNFYPHAAPQSVALVSKEQSIETPTPPALIKCQQNEVSWPPISSQRFIENAKQLNLFGMNVPEEFGGLDFDAITTASLLESASTENLSAGIALALHNMTCRAINFYGTDEQRGFYLPMLSAGRMLGQLCRPDRRTKYDSSDTTNPSVMGDSSQHLSDDYQGYNNGLESRWDDYCGEMWYLRSDSPASPNSELKFPASDFDRLTLFTGVWSMTSHKEVEDESGARDHQFGTLNTDSFSHSNIHHHDKPFLATHLEMQQRFRLENRESFGLGGLGRSSVYYQRNIGSAEASSNRSSLRSNHFRKVIKCALILSNLNGSQRGAIATQMC